LGDGCLTKGNGSVRLSIANDIKVINRKILIKELKRIGLNISVYPDSLFIKKESRKLFFKYVLKHNKEIPKSYKYKFREELWH